MNKPADLPVQAPMASYALSIVANTGYSADTNGTCTPEQYAEEMAALHGTKPTRAELLTALRALRKASQHFYDDEDNPHWAELDKACALADDCLDDQAAAEVGLSDIATEAGEATS